MQKAKGRNVLAGVWDGQWTVKRVVFESGGFCSSDSKQLRLSQQLRYGVIKEGALVKRSVCWYTQLCQRFVSKIFTNILGCSSCCWENSFLMNPLFTVPCRPALCWSHWPQKLLLGCCSLVRVKTWKFQSGCRRNGFITYCLCKIPITFMLALFGGGRGKAVKLQTEGSNVVCLLYICQGSFVTDCWNLMRQTEDSLKAQLCQCRLLAHWQPLCSESRCPRESPINLPEVQR